MGEILLYTLSFALGILVPAVIVRWDLGRLSEERLARAWPDASLWAAVVVFGPLCLPVHFVRTRRSWVGLGLGLVALALAVFAISLPIEGLSRLFGIGD